MVFYVALIILIIAAVWKIFTKAGKPGWASIIPIYNLVVLMQIIGRPGWWAILYLIPLVNIVIAIINAFDLAKVFGRGTLFAIFGLILFQPVGYMILGFGKSTYAKSAGKSSVTPPTQAPTVPPVTPTQNPV